MLSRISFDATNSKENLWAAFQHNDHTQVQTVPKDTAKNQQDEFSKTNTNDETSNYSAYIWGGIIGAAVIAAGVWYYLKHHKPPIKPVTQSPAVPISRKPAANPTQMPPVENITADLSYKNIITAFTDTIPQKDKFRYVQALEQQKMHRANCFSLLKNDDGILSLEQFFAIQNAKLKNDLTLPHIVETPNLNSENTSNIGKVFYHQFKTNFEKRTYIKGDAEEFLSALENYTSQKSNRYTFMHIENFNELLSDLNKPENTSLLEKFKKLLSQNEKKKLCYLTEKSDEYTDIPIKKLSLDFKDGIKAKDFALDINHYDIEHTLKSTTETSQKIIDKSILKVSREEIGNIINGNHSFILIETAETKCADEFLNNISQYTGHRISDFDCDSKNILDVIENLKETLNNNLKIAGRTGKINFIRIKNLEKALQDSNVNSEECKKLLELLQTSNEKYKTVFIAYTESENKTFQKIAKKSGCIIKHNAEFSSEAYKKLEEAVLKRLKNNDFGFINPEHINTDYIRPLIIERLNPQTKTELLPGGILIRGKDAQNNIQIVNSLLNTFGNLVRHKKVKFDINNPEKSFGDIYNLAKKCGKDFAKTKCRTIIEIDNIDELMLRDVNERIFELQASLKSFVENCSKDNHVTILVKTSHAIKDFEPSCIGSQRFSRLCTINK